MKSFIHRLNFPEFFDKRLILPVSSCPMNCSGHGECHQDLCVCQIYFTGQTCHEPNTAYLATFGALFVCLGVIALIQLLLCVKSDYERDSVSSVRSACQVTIQKLLLILTMCATAIRAAYFFTKWSPSPVVASNLMSAYYPFLITGLSLIVCYWAEAFHVASSNSEKPRFLSKSILAFITFTVMLLLILVSQVAITLTDTGAHLTSTMQVFNGVFAGMMFIMAVLFLAYGTEVYFKVRGAFRQHFETVDWSQLHMSRLGLVSQGSLQLITTVFLVSYVLKEIWFESLPVLSLNFYVIGFHIAEFGVLLWFPCVLWNCKSPEQLWVLNPQKILKNLEFPENYTKTESQLSRQSSHSSVGTGVECWICYETEEADQGPMIQPCACRGDVSVVHHECLRRWLVESYDDSTGPPACKVCNEKYSIKAGPTSLSQGLTVRHWLQALLGVTVFTVCPAVAYIAYRSLRNTIYQCLVIGTIILVQLATIKLFCHVCRTAYKRARLASVKIEDRIVSPDSVLYCCDDRTPVLEKY